MDGSSKILTVSYGTFSCTLEGFDDPLDAMRDIAEYFRDLASDDRYFGAEPPTPDPEMLQTIAEREVNRRVEAKVSETGVALRQIETEEPDAEIAARVVSAAATPAPAEQPRPEPEPEAEPSDTGPLAFDDEYLLSDEPEDVLAVDPDAKPPSDAPAESVAEKLRRIRAVVSRNIEPSVDPSSFSAAQAADAGADEAKRDRALTETIEAITADLSDDEEAPYQGDAIEASEPEPAPEPEPTPEPEPEPEQSEDQQFEDDLAEAVEESRVEPLQLKDEAPSQDEAEAEPEVEAAFQEPEEDLAADSLDAMPAEDDLAEPAAAIGDDWDFDDTPDDDIGGHDDDDDGFEEESEDDLGSDESIQQTVSQIIGKVAGRVDASDDDNEAPEDDADEDKGAEATEKAREATRPLSPEPEGDVGRLMAETDTKLNDDDVVRRRRVISQMRAAVAATKADRMVSRQVSREVVEEEEQSQYREDLSEAVRDTPPLPKEDGERPKSSAPPLVLVSSQRVDVETVAPETEDFAEFAESMGARELPELLEAAAAYTVFSEGQSSFTRPEIMKRVARVDPTLRLSREESLRSFGRLLRQGKFRKLERGQFTIDKDSRFNPKHRIAGE
ncbi:MAG: hypothetical protein HKN18_16095 [Silicimonas sp.]|nr:hypothetical protein [Silicimonas sp.]